LLLAALTASPAPVSSAGPMPSATPCAIHFRDANMVDPNQLFEHWPTDLPEDFHILVKVYLDARGVVEKADVLESSGLFTVDSEVVRTLKHMDFRPKIVDCVAVPGIYALRLR